MLQTLAIHGFRAFESYRLTNLTRVNLVVGRNNCGKTSVLEAIELLVSGGDPAIFYKSAQRRGEMGVRQASDRHTPAEEDVSHVFFGHKFNLGTHFKLSSDNDGDKYTLSVKVQSLDEVGEDWDRRRKRWRQLGYFDPDENKEAVPGLVLAIDGGRAGREVSLPAMDDGTVLFEPYPRSIRNGADGTPVHFLTLDSFNPASMGRMWDTVLAEGREEEIVNDMRILEPELDSIHFLTSRRLGGGILVGLRNRGRRLPIGTYGDGMRRLLALRLSFVGAANGFLLIDEIDTGLHWTIMEEMWQFVVEVARNLNIQIFATTHSYDCIQGFGSLISSRPDLKEDMSIQKVDTSLKQAVCLRGDQIKIAVEQDIEVR